MTPFDFAGPAPGAALARLLGSLSPQEFVGSYWQKRPLHLAGDPDRFKGLFDLDALLAAVQLQHERGLSIRVSSDREGDDGAAAAHVPVDHTELAELFDRGVSVCVDPIDRADERVLAFAGALKRDLGHAGPVGVKAYLSPPGFGFNTHFDAHVVTTLQIEGKKRWRISREPGVPEPVRNAFVDARGGVRYMGCLPSELRPWERVDVDESRFEEIVLEEGDVLCLPAGTWHNAKAVERSLALNVAFSPVTAWEILWDLIRPALQDRAKWRQSLPAAPDAQESEEVPEEVAGFLAERIHELIEHLGAVQQGSGGLDGLWRRAVNGRPVGASGSALFARQTGLGSPAARLGTQAPAQDRHPAKGSGSLGYTGTLSCALVVGDLREAVAWYESVLGMRTAMAIYEFGWAEMDTSIPGVKIGLSEVPVEGLTAGGVLNFAVDDVEEARRRLEQHEVTFEGPTQEVSGVTKLAGFVDPFGNKLMIHERSEG